MWSILVLFGLLSHFVDSFIVVVDSYGESCFFERAPPIGDKMHFMYEVIEGGFLDIDVTVKSPDNILIYDEHKKPNGRLTFTSTAEGNYFICFTNGESSVAPKTLVFNFAPANPKLPIKSGASDVDNKLTDMVNELSAAISSVKNEIEYMELRGDPHRQVNESTNFRVVLWAGFEACLLITMSLGQVFYLKRFFEVRRLI